MKSVWEVLSENFKIPEKHTDKMKGGIADKISCDIISSKLSLYDSKYFGLDHIDDNGPSVRLNEVKHDVISVSSFLHIDPKFLLLFFFVLCNEEWTGHV